MKCLKYRYKLTINNKKPTLILNSGRRVTCRTSATAHNELFCKVCKHRYTKNCRMYWPSVFIYDDYPFDDLMNYCEGFNLNMDILV